MRRLLYGLLLAGGLLTAPVQAQSAFGLGVALNTGGLVGPSGGSSSALSPVTFYLPFRSPGLRFEPEFGLARVSSGSNSATAFQFGLGVAGQRRTAATALYGGARAGALVFASDGGGGTDAFFVGPVAGAEHFLDEAFSVGAEAQLLYQFGGDSDVDFLRTRGQIVARFYF